MPDIAASPRALREIEHLWIPFAGGTRLAARMRAPRGSDTLVTRNTDRQAGTVIVRDGI